MNEEKTANPQSDGLREGNFFWTDETAYLMVATGEYARLPAFAAALIKGTETPAERAYAAACYLAICIPVAQADTSISTRERQERVEQYAKQSVHYLEQAVQSGYRDTTWMNRDPDLDSIRDRAEFKQLIQKLSRELAPPPRLVK